MKRTNELIVGLAVLAVISVITWGIFAVGDNMTPGVSIYSGDVFQLHNTVLGIVTIIGVLVFTAMFTSIVVHRRSKGHDAAGFSHSTKAEIIWTAIPVLILVVMSVPATRVLIDMERTGGADMNIKITGYQWLWQYEYIEEDISFYSALERDSNRARQLGSGVNPREVDNYLLDVDNPLVVPVGTRIRFLLTSDDVIHSWWVPDLGWKRDAVPGMVNEAWTLIEEEGTYRGQCAELCGADHGFMPIVVEAVSQEEFAAWVAEQREEMAQTAHDAARLWTREELMNHGSRVYQAQCASCHQSDGSGLEPAFPALVSNGVPSGDLKSQLQTVLHGREGTAMDGFRDRLQPQDIAAALTFARNAWNDEGTEGEIIQPASIAELDQG
ncbi:cytochrome c oxidase subunit II [Wenzhouxiangella limi]|uniref:Cytochrome c oxidase subunit 2 n=1 Tax=Wenzhouxiangella limi TaxID=2707351 RepID=A0A845UY51_9GAMM|nr:cytochrome c oxidase subunit II [Wenzhouxiangella limi]NDY94800.1 cytochrome c oxidase subunit II [Wenzhouxiangella limi]